MRRPPPTTIPVHARCKRAALTTRGARTSASRAYPEGFTGTGRAGVLLPPAPPPPVAAARPPLRLLTRVAGRPASGAPGAADVAQGTSSCVCGCVWQARAANSSSTMQRCCDNTSHEHGGRGWGKDKDGNNNKNRATSRSVHPCLCGHAPETHAQRRRPPPWRRYHRSDPRECTGR